jgi:hypothetical protein
MLSERGLRHQPMREQYLLRQLRLQRANLTPQSLLLAIEAHVVTNRNRQTEGFQA